MAGRPAPSLFAQNLWDLITVTNTFERDALPSRTDVTDSAARALSRPTAPANAGPSNKASSSIASSTGIATTVSVLYSYRYPPQRPIVGLL